MAETISLTREEGIGIGLAVAAHVALAAFLMLQDNRAAQLPPPERIDVSLATEVSLESTAPDPSAEPAAAFAPELAPELTPPAPPEVVTPPRPTATQRPAITPPVPPRPSATPTRRPAPTPSASARPTPTPTQRPTPAPSPTRSSGGSRIGADFLPGNSNADGNSGTAAATVGPAERASIGQAIIRQLRPHWNPPSGVDVDQLVTVVRFRLNRDGTLAATPEVLRTTGQNDANRNQVSRHQEQAVRAVRLAAPFNLPEAYYSGWSVVTSNFDNRLAQ